MNQKPAKLLSKIIIPLLILLLIAIFLRSSSEKNNNEIKEAKTAVYKVAKRSGLDLNQALCEYGYGQSILGSGAGTRYVMYFEVDKNFIISTEKDMYADYFSEGESVTRDEECDESTEIRQGYIVPKNKKLLEIYSVARSYAATQQGVRPTYRLKFSEPSMYLIVDC